MDPAQHLWVSFLAGLFTPLGSVCVVPLYPGFLAYLAHEAKGDHQKRAVLLGITVTTGVLAPWLSPVLSLLHSSKALSRS